MRILCALVCCAAGCASDFEFAVSVAARDTSSFAIHVDAETYPPTLLDDGRYVAEVTRRFSSYDAARSDGEMEFSVSETGTEIFRRTITPGLCDEDVEWESEELRYGISRVDGVEQVGELVIVCRDGDHVATLVP